MRPLPLLHSRRGQSRRPTVPSGVAASARSEARRLERGQALVMFILMSVVMIGAVAIVTDISWVWYGQQRMQRAADAAALAGAVYLPGDPATAYSSARAEAAKNGFTDGSGGVSVTPVKDPLNNRRIIVTINGPIGSFFARAIGITQFTTGAESRAEYVLPVPMGSPENYYGVGYYVATSSQTNDVVTPGTVQTASSNASATWLYTPGDWTSPAAVRSQDCANGTGSCSTYATSANAANTANVFGNQGFSLPAPAANQTLNIVGIEARVRARLSATATGGCTLTTELSWNNGATWSTGVDLAMTSNGFPSSGSGYVSQGSASSTSAWGSHAWTRTDFNNGNLLVRLTFKRSGNCQTVAARAQVDFLQLRVSYRTDTTTQVTTYSNDGVQDITGPTGNTLRRQNFWGSMQSQGAPNIQGDAFMTYYNTRTSATNASYDPNAYYQYGVDIPAGASNGKIWVFDPGFCDTGTGAGTGENWTIGGSNGNGTIQPISSFFDVYDTNGTPYDVSDDALVGGFNNDYRRSLLQDLTAHQGTSVAGNPPDCRGNAWHDQWVQVASGLTGGGGGKTYRIHTYSTDQSSPTDQTSSTALNNFAFYASASGGTPKVYGIGAMEAYYRLPQNQTSDFYMAQIEAVHAGKTMIIELWDPGDTGNLPATLQVLQPTASGYTPAAFSYTATQGSNAAAACSSLSGTNVTSVVTNTGGTSRFNGCWLTITIPLPANYSAPLPSTDTIATQGGWWQMRYIMGSGSGNATDLTTWKVSIRGNPVHLVVP
jgi:hypothetical protein